MYGTAKNSQQKKEDTACSQSQCITGVPVYKEIAYSTNQKTEKEDIVGTMKEFIPNFEHIEKGKNLDQKM